MERRPPHALGAPWLIPGLAIALLVGTMAACSSSGNPAKGAAPSASSLAPIHGSYAPKIAPSNYVATIDNPYFPLKPGTTFLYKGVHENGKTPQTDEMVVTHQTKVILGVRSVVVRDTVSSRGKPIERTFDWYAQDKYGNVWYMGEDTREVRHGHFVKMGDSWQGGVNGAEPGIIMPGNPEPGVQYRQEYYPHHAMDQAQVLGRGGPIQVPFGRYGNTLLTVETSPTIDPGVAEDKYYVAGLGDIKEQTVSGNHEEIELIRVTHA
jgi:hypothetical protein